MTIRRHMFRHRGMTLVETSLVSIIALSLLLGTTTVGLGVFRYQQLTWLAREGAQWASVHGGTYQQETKATAPKSQDILTNVVNPKLVGMSPGSVTCTISMTSTKATVTLSYTWIPETF